MFNILNMFTVLETVLYRIRNSAAGIIKITHAPSVPSIAAGIMVDTGLMYSPIISEI